MNPPKLFLDENLSPFICVVLREDGVDASHVRDRGMFGATDAEVLERAYAEDRLLVTLNVDDFVRLVRARDLHAGIVLIEQSGLTREEQLDVVRRALALIVAELEAGRDMVNRVLWIDLSVHSFEHLPR